MRRQRIRGGAALLLLVAVFAVLFWDNVIDLSTRQRRYARIAPGMTLEEVEAVMGGKGDSPDFDIVGASKRWRWEDAYTTVDVVFPTRAPKPDQPLHPYLVTDVVQHDKHPPELGGLWLKRSTLYLLALMGVAYIVRGLLTPKSA